MSCLTGIYKIANTQNGKIYVGSSLNIKARWSKHLSALRRGVHKNAHLQSAFAIYGEHAFQFNVLELCDEQVLLTREQHYLDTLRPEYNILPIAGNSTGYRHGYDAKRKMSATHIGNKHFLGKRHSESTKQKLAALRVGSRLSPEHVARIKEANLGNTHTLGRQLTEEHKAKVSSALKSQWDDGARSRNAAAERVRAKWADPQWKAQQLAKIAQGRAAKRAERSTHGQSAV